jgi:TusA-related sulfurtransferase
MSSEYETTETLDVKGMNCPMPVVKTKQAIDELDPGTVLEVLATDPGSMSDIEGWANSTDGVELLDQVEDESGSETIYRHYIRRATE